MWGRGTSRGGGGLRGRDCEGERGGKGGENVGVTKEGQLHQILHS